MARESPQLRPLRTADLDDADRLFRVAFGTFLGAPEPERFFGDADYVRTRFLADPEGAVGAFIGDELVGSNFLTRWGSVGFFGPLTVSPTRWDAGIGQALLEQTMATFEAWGTRHLGLFTFSQSAKHVSLYQRFGFWPRYLTAIMAKPLEDEARDVEHLRLAALDIPRRTAAVAMVRELTDDLYGGLDLSREIAAVLDQGLGDVLVIEDGDAAHAVAICHVGAGTEAGGGNCYVKFACARPGPGATAAFDRLLDACSALARSRGADSLVAGANAERPTAWSHLCARGFRPQLQGVAMHRPNDPGYNAGDALVVDDWR